MKNESGAFTGPSPTGIREIKAYVEERREETTPFDMVLEGETPGDDPERAVEVV